MVVRLTQQDRRKLDELRRIKFLATAALVLCFGVMVIAKLLEAGYPWLAAVAAFATAFTAAFTFFAVIAACIGLGRCGASNGRDSEVPVSYGRSYTSG